MPSSYDTPPGVILALLVVMILGPLVCVAAVIAFAVGAYDAALAQWTALHGGLVFSCGAAARMLFSAAERGEDKFVLAALWLVGSFVALCYVTDRTPGVEGSAVLA